MPLSAAERCRRYREKLKQTNPEKFEELKKKNAERTKAKKRKITDMSEEEKRAVRKKWRDAKRKKTEKTETLPPAVSQTERQRRTYRSKLLRENKILKAKYKRLLVRNASLQKALQRYKKRNIALSTELNTLSIQLNEEKKDECSKSPETTPITKFLETEIPNIPEKSKEKIRKKLIESRVLEDSLKETYKASRSNKEKQVLKKLLESEPVKKYKLQFKIRSCLGLKRGIRHYHSFAQKKKRTAREIRKFFERDDVSRMTAGKKECLTRNKIKKQKRFLLNTLSNLYKVYRSKGGGLSFSTFKRYRPFYVISPRAADRNTCACSKHANLEFKARTLYKAGLIVSANLENLVSEIVCDTKSKKCMYSECKECFAKKLSFNLAAGTQEEQVYWQEWMTVTHEYEKSGISKTTKKTVQVEKTGTLITLANIFQDELVKFKTHYFNIYHQHRQYKEAIEQIQDNETIIHCDFSENYASKMAEEVQSMHYAGSRQQITLHTGVAYVKKQKPIAFCTISPSLKHDPQAIWGHLSPVIEYLKEKYPAINCVHFYSDGPTTQYRQKKNFWLFSKKSKEAGFVQATWSFFEASHGKGAADGVGGAIKRTLDNKVAYGGNIVDAMSAFESLSKTETTIKLFYVSENIIENVEIPENIKPVPDTMKIHQIVATENTNIIKYRPLSCFCARGNCDCFSPKTHNFETTKTKKTEDTAGNPKIIKKRKITREKRKDKRPKKTNKSASTSEDNDSCEIQYDDDSVDDCSYASSDDSKTTREMDSKHQKVTILSDVRNREDNQAYFDLKKYGPLSLKPININVDLFSQNTKENIDMYANPVPCSSKDEPTHDTFEIYMLTDSILVRYYQRKTWKYYVGFIDKIEIKKGNTFYSVHYLKTIKSENSIHFITPKKKDFDIINIVSIVKKIKITPLKQEGQYCLTDEDADKIYF